MKRLLFIASILAISINVAYCQTFKESFMDTVQQEYKPNTEIFNLELKPTFGKMFGKSLLNVFKYNLVIYGAILVLPECLTKWDPKGKFNLHHIADQYHLTFTKPPIIDDDLIVVNFAGHPYQGSFYYNSVRSQGATIFQSAIVCSLNTVIWEYCWEGSQEQPSIQDLLVTPILGSLLGELIHKATLKMRKNGFTQNEKIITCIINPNYVINNGFKSKQLISINNY